MQTEIRTEPATVTSYLLPADDAVDEILDRALDADLDLLDADLDFLDDDEYPLPGEEEVDEIVDSFLDAADVEILEDLGAGPAGAAGPDGAAARATAGGAVLLRRLMVDVLRRHQERQRLQAGGGA